jgi:hypothetical protein
MVILFPLGIMNLATMALVTLIIFAEKTLAWERIAVYAAAAALMLYGTLIIARPHLLPTYGMAAPLMEMNSPLTDKPAPMMPGMPTKP